MRHILRRELAAYFSTPFGFVFLGIFMLLSGVMFTIYNLLGANGSMNGTFDMLKNVSFLVFPMLTMRMFAEERRSGIEPLLLTSRLTACQIVLGKLIAAELMFLLALFCTSVYVIIIAIYGMPDYFSLAASYLGFFLLGASMIAVCAFFSSFAENQITAAVASFGALFFMVILASFTKSLAIPFLTPVLSAAAITTRYDEFTRGILRPGPVIYYVSVVCVFAFFTVKNCEKRRLD
ncbi:MAG: ABC transporter permease [Synergistaceae bacterium]|jgi:ABC-2 type transport system permease protein|nr:ABC transporter permease [Synergistaceae bacterium]